MHGCKALFSFWGRTKGFGAAPEDEGGNVAEVASTMAVMRAMACHRVLWGSWRTPCGARFSVGRIIN